MNDACASAGDKNLINVNWKEMSGGGLAGAWWFAQPLEVEKISLSRLTPLEKTSHALESESQWTLTIKAGSGGLRWDVWLMATAYACVVGNLYEQLPDDASCFVKWMSVRECWWTYTASSGWRTSETSLAVFSLLDVQNFVAKAISKVR